MRGRPASSRSPTPSRVGPLRRRARALANAPLRDRIDEILRAAMRDGTARGIFRRWESGTTISRGSTRACSRRRRSGIRSRRAARPDRAAGPHGRSTPRRATCRRCFARPLITLAPVVPVDGARGRSSGVARRERPRVRQTRSRAALTGYVEVIRGTPVLLQLFVIYYGLAAVVRLPGLRRGAARARPELRGVRERDLSRRAGSGAARAARGGAHARASPSRRCCGSCAARRRSASRSRR